MILVICQMHKEAWFLCRHGENDDEVADMDGHFNARSDPRWETECVPQVVALGEPQVRHIDSEALRVPSH